MPIQDNQIGKSVQNFDKCPKCNCLNVEVDISNKKMMTTCNKCGFKAENIEFHKHSNRDNSFTI